MILLAAVAACDRGSPWPDQVVLRYSNSTGGDIFDFVLDWTGDTIRSNVFNDGFTYATGVDFERLPETGDRAYLVVTYRDRSGRRVEVRVAEPVTREMLGGNYWLSLTPGGAYEAWWAPWGEERRRLR